MDNYHTDDWILSLFKDWFDPCPYNEDPQFTGLEIEWGDRTFVNPPYSNPLPWVKKAIVENKKGNMIVMLLKMDTSTSWFKELQQAGAHFLWINGRLKHKTNIAAPFPSMLCILE